MSPVRRMLGLHSVGRRTAARAVSRHACWHGAGNAALGWAGVVLAGASAAFAIRMIVTRHDPLIRDMQYLAIFAQPNSAALRRAQSSPPAALAEARPAPRVDYTPTASFEKPARATPFGVLPEKPAYEILGATEQTAWLRIGDDILEARKGQVVPRVGKILAIERRAGAWRLIVDNERSGSRGSRPPALQRNARRFERKLIFGDERP